MTRTESTSDGGRPGAIVRLLMMGALQEPNRFGARVKAELGIEVPQKPRLRHRERCDLSGAGCRGCLLLVRSHRVDAHALPCGNASGRDGDTWHSGPHEMSSVVSSPANILPTR